MAERPRLKETDEILYSVAKKRRQAVSQPVLLPTDVLPPPITKPGEETPPAKRQRGGKRAASGGSPRGDGAAGEQEDSRPLDFGKYEIPQKKSRAKTAPAEIEEDFAAPALVELVGAGEIAAPTAVAEPAPEPAAAPPTPAPAPIRKAPAARREEAAPPAPRKAILTSPEASAADVKAFEFEDWDEKERKAKAEKEAREAAQKAADDAREAKAKAMEELEERRAEAAKAADEHRGAEARRKMLEDDRYRENAFKQLSTRFEEEFSQQFERKKERKAKEKPSWVPEKEKLAELPLVLEGGAREAPPPRAKRSPIKKAPAKAPETVGPPVIAAAPPEPESEPEPAPPQRRGAVPPPVVEPEAPPPAEEDGADEFFALFEREVKEEEDVRAEDFKETLAQKFMRERERYLEELGIADRMEAEKAEEERLRLIGPEPAEPPRRRLNLQIQPEMHLQEGETASPVRPYAAPSAARPVTYSRNAAVEPQRAGEEETENGTVFLTGPDPELFRAAMEATGQAAVIPAPAGKKSAEQMLLELGEQNKRRAVEKPLQAKEHRQFSFSFKDFGEADEKEPGQRPKRGPLSPAARMRARVIALSAAAGVLALALLTWGISSVLDGNNVVAPDGAGVSEPGAESANPNYEAFNSYTATEQTPKENVFVKRTGITLGNLTVSNSIVVEELAEVEGPLTLNNMIVDNAIYVKSSGNNELILTDVRANRIIINNDRQPVTIRVSGNTDVGTVEARTGVTIEQGELSGDSQGVRDVIVQNENPGEPVDFGVTGAAVQTVNTLGAVNASFDGAAVETMTSDGDLTLNGTGRVQTLSVGLGAGQGAGDFITGDFIQAAPLSVLIKGVEVGHLNVKSAANLNISANVDSMAASDPVNIGGNGTVASLVLNEEFGNSRLAVELTGVSIQQLTANAEAVINAGGSSTVNTLIANASVYALGNKVNLLVANADGVIYENDPDSRRVATGVAQPQTKADNPHLDYSLTGASAETAAAGESTPVSANCEHPAELGGYRQGDGSRTNPFLVESAAMLAHVTEHPASHFKQAADVDVADDSQFAGGFPMLCAMGERFSGSYDGQGYAIKNLSIYSEQEYVGLFAENTGTIMNVRIDSGDVTCGSIDSFAGAVVGFNYQGGQVVSCSNGAVVVADMSSYAGGIVGYNYGGKVRDCYNSARVTGGEFAGGLVGMNRTDASITGSYNVGLVEANGAVGAIAGGNEDAVITNCFYLVRSADEALSGTGAGNGNAVSVGAQELASAQMAAMLAAGNDASLWRQSEDDSYPYPVHERPSGSSAPAAEIALPPPGAGTGSVTVTDGAPAEEGAAPAPEENVFEEDFADYQDAPLIE